MYPREPESMKELREVTAKHPWFVLISSPRLKFINFGNNPFVNLFFEIGWLADVGLEINIGTS